MCVVSNVSDFYWKKFDPWLPGSAPESQQFIIHQTVDLSELRKLIDEFKEAMKAAKTVDRLTGQPDCVDPEKAKLQERVAELEKKLADIGRMAT